MCSNRTFNPIVLNHFSLHFCSFFPKNTFCSVRSRNSLEFVKMTLFLYLARYYAGEEFLTFFYRRSFQNRCKFSATVLSRLHSFTKLFCHFTVQKVPYKFVRIINFGKMENIFSHPRVLMSIKLLKIWSILLTYILVLKAVTRAIQYLEALFKHLFTYFSSRMYIQLTEEEEKKIGWRAVFDLNDFFSQNDCQFSVLMTWVQFWPISLYCLAFQTPNKWTPTQLYIFFISFHIFFHSWAPTVNKCLINVIIIHSILYDKAKGSML